MLLHRARRDAEAVSDELVGLAAEPRPEEPLAAVVQAAGDEVGYGYLHGAL